jgi:hypothetical protein
MGFRRSQYSPANRQHMSSDNAFVAVANRARRASDRSLAAAELAGFAAAVAVLALAPRSLDFALPAVAVGALGLWGITDHMIDARRNLLPPLRWALLGFRLFVATAGVGAAVLSGYALIGRLMGVVIS